MTHWVVDASVAIKWFVPEPLSQHAVLLLRAARAGNAALAAPDLMVAEFGSVLGKKVRAGELAPDEAREVWSSFLTLPLETVPSAPLALAALEIAAALGCTFYDALYLAAAQAVQGRVVTADEELSRLVRRSPLSDLLLTLDALPLEL